MAEKNTVTLSAPVEAHGEELKVLKFREPTGADIMKFGYPVALETKRGKGMRVSVDTEIAGTLAAHLAGIPPSVIRCLPLADFNAVVGTVAGFFMESLKTLFSTVTST